MRPWCRSCRRCRKCIRGANRCRKTYLHIKSLSKIRVCALSSSMALKARTKNCSDSFKERIQSSKNRWSFSRNKTLFKWHQEATWFRQMLRCLATSRKLWLSYRRTKHLTLRLRMEIRISIIKQWPRLKGKHRRRIVILPINRWPPRKFSLKVALNARWQSSTSIKMLKRHLNNCSNQLMKSQRLRW